MRPNFPGSDHPHPLHGFGWLSSWAVDELTATTCRMTHDYVGGEWPWPYCAEQPLTLSEEGIDHIVRLENRTRTLMPSGLGLHPYFPRTERSGYWGLHRDEWRTSTEELSLVLNTGATPIDW